ncbi:hypothetical protein BRD02_01570 [Halobacteriales archaeon QS_8_69_73]|nr:MAG: hypothetical protein BRD02_01570 [Halobacteriales archaeon QS_8_69_73]
MIGGALEWLADALAGLTDASSVRILAALVLGLAALYARRITSFGRVLGRGMSIVVAVLVVLAAGIGLGALDPDISVATGLIAKLLEAGREAIR